MKKLFTAILFLTALVGFGQTQSQYDQYKGTASGTDSYSVTITPATFPLYDGERVTVTYTVTNTGAATLRLAQSASTYSTSAIRLNNSALVAGDIPINTPMTMTYVKASNTWSMARSSTNTLEETFVGVGNSSDKLSGSSKLVHLDFGSSGNVLSLTNTVTTGAGVIAAGNGSSAFNMSFINSGYVGNYTGTSVAFASTSNLITTNYAPLMIQDLPVYISTGTGASDKAFRFDGTGLKIGLNSTIHTGPSQALEVNGGSGTTLKIVDGNQALGRVLVSTATGVAGWADYRTLLSADGNQKAYVDNDYAEIISGYNTFPTSASITLAAISGSITSQATSHYWLSPGGNDFYFGNNNPATAHGVFNFGSVASSNKTYTWPNQSGTVGLINTATVSLTAAQLKTANSVPIDIAVSPGAGKAILLIGATCQFVGNTTGFTTNYLWVKTESQSAPQAFFNLDMSLLTTQYSNSITDISVVTSGSTTIAANKKLQISADADSATGDGTAKILVQYMVIDTF